LVSYENKNEYIEASLHQISFDLRELEGMLFDINIRHEINVAPMKYYIEDWLKWALLTITEEHHFEEVETGSATTTRDNIKGTSKSKWTIERIHHSKSKLITLHFYSFSFQNSSNCIFLYQEEYDRILIVPLSYF